MPASEAPHPTAAAPDRWLLIGNSRWHWAEMADAGLRCWDQDPAEGVEAAREAAPLAWAAVGTVPAAAGLDEAHRLGGGDVPLLDLPPWLGIDRALGGWQAWQEQPGLPVLVADAGTVLSLTRVDRQGRFRGGRLLAGVALQLRAMAAGTRALPDLSAALPSLAAASETVEQPWPAATAAAMVEGVKRGLVAVLADAAREVHRADGPCRLVLTGGDGALLQQLLAASLGAPIALDWRPQLCLEGLARLRPASRTSLAPLGQARPRSARI